MLSFYQPTRETLEFASLLFISAGEAWSDVSSMLYLVELYD
jgi:hypothetical protein